MSSPRLQIKISPHYQPDQSDPASDSFCFSYTIAISNQGTSAIQLLERYWLLTDGNGTKREVQGSGVVGKQPIIKAGQSFEYTSSVVFDTPIGFMEGHYTMRTQHGDRFDAPMPPFRLAKPGLIQ